jgi:ribosomal protein L4
MIIDNLLFDGPKTKIAANTIKTLSTKLDGYKVTKKKHDSILFVMPGTDRMVIRAMNNLPRTQILSADSLNVKDVLEKKYLILLKDAIGVIERTYQL